MGEGNLFVSLEHLAKKREQRINETELNAVDIYTFYGRLLESKQEAAKFIAKIIKIDLGKPSSGISFQVLTNDFQPFSDGSASGYIADGFWSPQDPKNEITMDSPVFGYVSRGFFVTYDDGMPSGFDQMLAQHKKELAMSSR